MSDVDNEDELSSRTSVSETPGKAGKKSKRTPRASKKEFENLRSEFSTFQGKVDSIDSKLALLNEFLTSQSNLVSRANKDKENDLPEERRPCRITDNVPVGERRPNLSLGNSLNAEFGVSDPCREEDVLSLQPGQRERQEVDWATSGRGSSRSNSDVVLVEEEASMPDRFSKYNSKTAALLAEMFGEDAVTTPSSEISGISLDESQIKVIEASWRCADPSKLTAYKEGYRSVFPVNDLSEPLFRVPSLDSMLETMLVRKYGSKAAKSQSLCSQPLKSLEKLAYQGQHAARMGLVINTYLQQALGNLLTVLKEKNVNIDSAIQCVRDTFAMSTKALDQVARAGAFHHLIRRRAAMSDSGLYDISDVKEHLYRLPLSHEGVFGLGLEKKLKDRKELQSQLCDLLPDNERKRKQNASVHYQWKRPRYDDASRSRSQKRPSGTSKGHYGFAKGQERGNSRTSGVNTFRPKSRQQL